MAAINRDATPPGPVTELFDRLDQLRLAAGRPSMREIALRAGRGRISSSTVHNVFRRTRVPRWIFVAEIVKALDGDPATFKALWEAAWQAENRIQVPAASLPAASPASQGPMEPGPGTAQRIRSNEIPARNLNFTGRVAELERLRANLNGPGRGLPPVQILSGMGGIGKTEIASEYIHRNRDRYDIIWWIRAEHHDRVRDALVRLGEKLELRQAIAGSGRDRAITAVLETLGSGILPSWLLVYDNAAQPLELQRYLPKGLPGGHVIITTRLPAWPGYVPTDYHEVSLFSAEEAVSLLRRRVPALSAGDDLDMIHEAGRNLIEVRGRLRDSRIGRTHSKPPAVNEHQGTARSKSAQVRRGDAACAGQTGCAVAEILAQIIGEYLRQLADNIGNVGFAGHLDGLRRDDLDGAGAHFIRRGDA